MLVITNLETKQLTPDYVSLEWTIQSTAETLSNYRLYVWRSMVISSNLQNYMWRNSVNVSNLPEFELIASGINPQTTAYYNDTLVQGMTSKTIDYFYKIQISGIVSPYDSSFTTDYTVSTTCDKYAREIMRRRHLVFSLHSSQPFFLLKRRAYGTYCPTCYDETLQRTVNSKCSTCYDTGFSGGYFGLISMLGQLSERPVRSMYQIFGNWQDQDAVLYCEALPALNPKDIIVDRLVRRWIVLTVGGFSKRTYGLGQIVHVRQIEKEDIAYTFPVTY